MNLCLPILLLVCITVPLFGQGETTSLKIRKSYLRLGVGIMHTRMIDEGYTDSHYLFRGTNAKLSLAYGRETENYIFNFTIEGSMGDLESKQGDLPSNYYFLEPSLEWLKPVTRYSTFGKENKLFLGAQLSSLNQGIENEKVVNNISIFSLHGMYLNVLNRLQLTQKHHLQLNYSLPVVVYENQALWNGGASKYTAHDSENIPKLLTDNGSFNYFNIFGNLQLGIDYILKTGKSTSLRVGYNFTYVNSHVESRLGFYSNDLLFELKIGL